MIEIKNRYDGSVILSVYADCLIDADLSYANLRYADLRYADLRYADLSYADLSYANLSGANLSNAVVYRTIGDGATIRSAQFEKYTIVVCDDWLQIGCQGHRYHEWIAFSDDQISEMDKGALEWWNKYKTAIAAFADCN